MSLNGSITITADTTISVWNDARVIAVDDSFYLLFGLRDDYAGAIAACDRLIEQIQEVRTAALGRLAGAVVIA